MAHPRTVYLYDDLDAIGERRIFWPDIVDARRILNMFLSFLDGTQPESLIVAVADHPTLLDDALLSRFDAVIAYYLPDSAQALDLLRKRLGAMDTSAVSWDEIGNHVKGMSAQVFGVSTARLDLRTTAPKASVSMTPSIWRADC